MILAGVAHEDWRKNEFAEVFLELEPEPKDYGQRSCEKGPAGD